MTIPMQRCDGADSSGSPRVPRPTEFLVQTQRPSQTAPVTTAGILTKGVPPPIKTLRTARSGTRSSKLLFLTDTQVVVVFHFNFFRFPLSSSDRLVPVQHQDNGKDGCTGTMPRVVVATLLRRYLIASAPTTSSSSKLEDNVLLFFCFVFFFVMPLEEGRVFMDVPRLYMLPVSFGAIVKMKDCSIPRFVTRLHIYLSS